MKTKFFYLAMAVMTAFCTTACSSDDDDDNGGSSNNGKSAIVTPKYTDQACQLKPSTPIDLGKGYSLETIEMGESGRCYFVIDNESDDNDDKTVLNANYTYESGTYNVRGHNVIGKVKIIETRASQNIQLVIDLNITLNSGEVLKGETDVEGGIGAVKAVGSVTNNADAISTWKVRTKTSTGSPAGLLIDLEGDVNVFKTFSGGYLGNIRDEAEAQGAEFTDSERKDFEKTLEYVTFTKDFITLDYSDGTSDCGTWNWAGAEAKEFNLKMLSASMGNKFIIKETRGSIEYNKADGFLNVTLNANITGSKNYTAKLTIQLEQAPEVK